MLHLNLNLFSDSNFQIKVADQKVRFRKEAVV